ncbi:unnamed protein product, partial [Phaeothamnion confervicola]
VAAQLETKDWELLNELFPPGPNARDVKDATDSFVIGREGTPNRRAGGAWIDGREFASMEEAKSTIDALLKAHHSRCTEAKLKIAKGGAKGVAKCERSGHLQVRATRSCSASGNSSDEEGSSVNSDGSSSTSARSSRTASRAAAASKKVGCPFQINVNRNATDCQGTVGARVTMACVFHNHECRRMDQILIAAASERHRIAGTALGPMDDEGVVIKVLESDDIGPELIAEIEGWALHHTVANIRHFVTAFKPLPRIRCVLSPTARTKV